MDMVTAFYIQIIFLLITFVVLLRYIKTNDRVERKLEELERKLNKDKARSRSCIQRS